MFDKKYNLALFYPAGINDHEYQLLKGCGVKLVQLFVDQATLQLVNKLKDDGIGVVLRIPEEVVSTINSYARLQLQLRPLVQTGNIVAIIMGNEPDWHALFGKYIFQWGHPWGNEPDELNPGVGRLWRHGARIAHMMEALSVFPVKLITPGWKNRSLTEDDPPLPGKYRWAEGLRGIYGRANGNGVHIYSYGWRDHEVNGWRFKKAIQEDQGLFDQPLWINEFNVNVGDQVTRMDAVIDMIRTASKEPYIERIAHMCPFVMNGDANGWDRGYIMNTPEVYDMLKAFMEE